MPAYLAFRFVDGKIVEDEGYWNALPIYLAIQKANVATEEESSEDDAEGGE